jgi:hypothetical protein
MITLLATTAILADPAMFSPARVRSDGPHVRVCSLRLSPGSSASTRAAQRCELRR